MKVLFTIFALVLASNSAVAAPKKGAVTAQTVTTAPNGATVTTSWNSNGGSSIKVEGPNGTKTTTYNGQTGVIKSSGGR